MENEILVHLVRKLVDIYKKGGPSKALKQSRKAVKDHEGFPLLHRLHAMFVFENDQSMINSALFSAYRAVTMYPRSLEYRLFYISLLCNKVHATDATQKMLVVFECENALKVDEPLEPYWELYMHVVEKAATIKSGEEAVEFIKICLCNMVDLYYREADALRNNFLDVILLSSDSNSHEKMKITGDMINGDYHSCAFVQRMHSEFCFQSAMGVEDGEERKRFLDQAFCFAKIAHKVFDASMDYFINFYTRTLQRSDHLSHNHLRMVQHNLTKALDFHYSKEPYYKYLIKDNITDLREVPEYYKNCIRLLLTFIRTLEESFYKAINDDNQEFISIYYKYLDESNLRNFAEQSNFFRENIKYLLDNKPKLMIDEDLQTRDGKETVSTPELRDIVGEIVDMYKKEGSSEARLRTHDALQIYESSSILLRLHAKYTIENDRSEIESALKFAKTAVLLCPQSLEHRFFHASLLYNKAAAAKDNILLYWEVVSECDEALDLERPVEPLWVLHMVDKKIEGMKSEEEVVEYVKTCLRTLINMCYRAIDALPKSLLDSLRQLDLHDNLKSMHFMLNGTHRFCAFMHRMYSEFCFEYALEMVNIKLRMRWLALAYVSAKSASDTFRSSMEYAINLFTRKLQCFYFSRREFQLLKQALENCFCETNNQEPYYKYLVDNNLTNHSEQRDYFQNCIGLLHAIVRTVEEVTQNIENEVVDDCKEGSARKLNGTEKFCKIYYEFLDEYNLRDFAEQSKFFNKNIKYFLENPPKVLTLGEEVLENTEDAKEESSEEKKKKNKKKKNKRKAKGLEVDLEDKEAAVNAFEDAKLEDLSQYMDAERNITFPQPTISDDDSGSISEEVHSPTRQDIPNINPDIHDLPPVVPISLRVIDLATPNVSDAVSVNGEQHVQVAQPQQPPQTPHAEEVPQVLGSVSEEVQGPTRLDIPDINPDIHDLPPVVPLSPRVIDLSTPNVSDAVSVNGPKHVQVAQPQQPPQTSHAEEDRQVLGSVSEEVYGPPTRLDIPDFSPDIHDLPPVVPLSPRIIDLSTPNVVSDAVSVNGPKHVQVAQPQQPPQTSHAEEDRQVLQLEVENGRLQAHVALLGSRVASLKQIEVENGRLREQVDALLEARVAFLKKRLEVDNDQNHAILRLEKKLLQFRSELLELVRSPVD